MAHPLRPEKHDDDSGTPARLVHDLPGGVSTQVGIRDVRGEHLGSVLGPDWDEERADGSACLGQFRQLYMVTCEGNLLVQLLSEDRVHAHPCNCGG